MIDQKRPTVANAERLHPFLVLDDIGLTRLVMQHRALRRMCDELEACADRLPDRQAVARAALVSAALAASLRDHDTGDHALLQGLVGADLAEDMASLVERIRYSHAIDLLHAEDLRDTLQSAVIDPASIRTGLMSYMMRCLFDGCRRGIDFQEAAMLLVANDRMTRAAREQLGASLRGG